MNSFERCRTIEQQSRERLDSFIAQRAMNGQYVTTDKGRLSKTLQKSVGDVLMNDSEGAIHSLEIKAEQKNLYGNFFLETWSNRKWFTPGWMITLDADVLLYHFIDDDLLYIIPFQKLKRWAWHSLRIYDFREKPQSKYEQMNDTWGRCVPIKIVADEVGCKVFRPLELQQTNVVRVR